jgi:hypothetical protein
MSCPKITFKRSLVNKDYVFKGVRLKKVVYFITLVLKAIKIYYIEFLYMYKFRKLLTAFVVILIFIYNLTTKFQLLNRVCN